MKATETYYENKIAKLEQRLANIRNVFDAFYKLGLPYIPIDAIRGAIMDEDQ